MTIRMKVFAVLIGVFIFIYIIELVRRRNLREEYSWLWLLTGAAIVILTLWYDLLVIMGSLLGGIMPSAVLFMFGLLFLLLISLYQSVKISRLTDQVKQLSQKIAMIELELKSNRE